MTQSNSITLLQKHQFFLFFIIFYAFFGFLYLNTPYSPDHAVYDYIGMVVNNGGQFYVDAADQNWPGQMFIHAVSVFLFGTEIYSYRLFELLIILPLSVYILYIFSQSLKYSIAYDN